MMKIRLSLHRISTALVLLMSLLILLIPIKSPFNRYDEGCMVFNAVRILDGDRPHKDFWAVYPPGQFYLLAAVFKTFGPSLLPARVYDTLVRFGIIFCIYIVCQKITSHKTLPLIVVLICALLLASAGSFGYPVFPAMLFALISIFCLLMDVERKRIWWPVGMGALSGLAAFFRWDIALYCGLSTLVTFFLLRFRGRMNTALPSKARLSLLSEFLLFPAGTLGTLLPLYLFQCRRSGTVQLWEQVVGFPLTTLREVRWKAYPELLSPFSLEWVRFYLPLILYGWLFLQFAYSYRDRKKPLGKNGVGIIAVSTFGLFLFAQALSRYDYLHVIPSTLMAVVAFGLTVPRTLARLSSRMTRGLIYLGLSVVAVLYLIQPVRDLGFSIRHYSPLSNHSRIPRADGISLLSDQEKAAQFILTHSSPGEAIFVGNQRHDRIFANDIGFYFLTGCSSATFYHELYPGVATTLPVQQTIAREISEKNVYWVVLVDFPHPPEPNAASVSSGVYYLDNFIRSNYAHLLTFGKYEIWEKLPE